MNEAWASSGQRLKGQPGEEGEGDDRGRVGRGRLWVPGDAVGWSHGWAFAMNRVMYEEAALPILEVQICQQWAVFPLESKRVRILTSWPRLPTLDRNRLARLGAIDWWHWLLILSAMFAHRLMFVLCDVWHNRLRLMMIVNWILSEAPLEKSSLRARQRSSAH